MARFLFYDERIINILLREEKPAGGAAVQALGWIRGLSEQGQQVYVLTNPAPRSSIKEECQGINLIPLYDPNKGIRWFRWLYYRLPYLYKKIKEVKPDYLYQGIPDWTSCLLGIICYLLNIKYVLRISNDFLVDDRIQSSYSRTHRFFQKLGFRLSRYILCQNDYQLSKIKAEFPGKKAYKITNPILLARTEVLESMPEKQYIAWLGLFQYQKNLRLLYEIALALPREQFVIAGKAIRDEEDIRIYVPKLQQLPNVTFIGFLHRHEVMPFLAKARFLLNTSHYEGFSNTFLEAMSVGTPILTSEKVNPDGIISQYHLGIVYKDAADLQEQMRPLTEARYQELSDNVSQYVHNNHHYQTLTATLMGILTEN